MINLSSQKLEKQRIFILINFLWFLFWHKKYTFCLLVLLLCVVCILPPSKGRTVECTFPNEGFSVGFEYLLGDWINIFLNIIFWIIFVTYLQIQSFCISNLRKKLISKISCYANKCSKAFNSSSLTAQKIRLLNMTIVNISTSQRAQTESDIWLFHLLR